MQLAAAHLTVAHTLLAMKFQNLRDIILHHIRPCLLSVFSDFQNICCNNPVRTDLYGSFPTKFCPNLLFRLLWYLHIIQNYLLLRLPGLIFLLLSSLKIWECNMVKIKHLDCVLSLRIMSTLSLTCLGSRDGLKKDLLQITDIKVSMEFFMKYIFMT